MQQEGSCIGRRRFSETRTLRGSELVQPRSQFTAAALDVFQRRDLRRSQFTADSDTVKYHSAVPLQTPYMMAL
jgi:hypothetical protein